jgi:hypothetical protein
MAATSIQEIKDFHDVIRLLEDHPEWRSELRRVLLTDALLALPDQLARLTEQVAALAAGQARTNERLAALDERLATLVEAQQRTNEQVAALAAGQARTDERLAALDDRMATLVEAQRHLTMSVQGLTDDVGALKGKGLEIHYRIYGSPFFGIILRRPQVVSMEELTDLLDIALDRGVLSPIEAMEIRRADVIIRGTRREDGASVHLVVEVSWSVDLEDVERAARRAALLAQVGLIVLPVVAGETVRPNAADLAHALHVWQVTNADVIAPAA